MNNTTTEQELRDLALYQLHLLYKEQKQAQFLFD